jgi:hypothetical protein
MITHILRGSKDEIVQRLTLMSGDVREAIVFEEEPTSVEAGSANVEDLFAEMIPYMVDVADVDDSREAIYTRMPGE